MKEVRSLQNFSSVGVHRSRFEYRALGLVSIISPSSKLEIMHCFFFFLGFLILQGILFQNLRIFPNWSTRWSTGSTSSSSLFLGDQPIGNRSTGSLGLLANDTIFSIFGALVQASSSTGAQMG